VSEKNKKKPDYIVKLQDKDIVEKNKGKLLEIAKKKRRVPKGELVIGFLSNIEEEIMKMKNEMHLSHASIIEAIQEAYSVKVSKSTLSKFIKDRQD
jgi:hypothetical protein